MTGTSARVATRRLINSLFVGFCFAVTAIALLALAAILFTLVKNGAGNLGASTSSSRACRPRASTAAWPTASSARS